MGNDLSAAMPLPHFLICGAARSATTWLYRALDSHPQVYLAKPTVPEPKFFHRDDIYAKGLAHYSATWFSDVPPGKTILGEKSTAYLENPQAAGRIHAHLPGARLVFLLRDPVERAFSNYLWSIHNGLETETFESALDLESEREATLPEKWRQVRPFSYFDRGLYARQLRPYFALFPRENILCLKSEDVARDPQALMARCFAFLGASPLDADFTALGLVNTAPNEVHLEMSAAARTRLEAAYAKPHGELLALLGPEFATW